MGSDQRDFNARADLTNAKLKQQVTELDQRFIHCEGYGDGCHARAISEMIGDVERAPEGHNISLRDVAEVTASCLKQAEFLSEWHVSAPCIEDRGLGRTPIDLQYLIGQPWPVALTDSERRRFRRVIGEGVHHRMGEIGFRDLSFWPAASWVGIFFRELSEFLSRRLQGSVEAGPGGALRFRVITREHGLRVHYSPAYFFNPTKVFGSPTTPVDGMIQPGMYKFGAVGEGFSLRFDPATYEVPPLIEARLLDI